jgi:hypothetical protein
MNQKTQDKPYGPNLLVWESMRPSLIMLEEFGEAWRSVDMTEDDNKTRRRLNFDLLGRLCAQASAIRTSDINDVTGEYRKICLEVELACLKATIYRQRELIERLETDRLDPP